MFLIGHRHVGTRCQVALHCATKCERGNGFGLFRIRNDIHGGPASLLATVCIAIWQTPRFADFARCFECKAFKVVRSYSTIAVTDLRRPDRQHVLVCCRIRSATCGDRITHGIHSGNGRDRSLDLFRPDISLCSAAGLVNKGADVVAARCSDSTMYAVTKFDLASVPVQAVMPAGAIRIEELDDFGPPDPRFKGAPLLIGDVEYRILALRRYQQLSFFFGERFAHSYFFTFDHRRLLKCKLLILYTDARAEDFLAHGADLHSLDRV